MKMKIFAAILVVLMVFSAMEVSALGPGDCLDSCSTGCVNSNERLRSRCERKCTIKCGPDAETQKLIGG